MMSKSLLTKEQKEAAKEFGWDADEKRDLFPIYYGAMDIQKEKMDKYNNSKIANDEKRAQWLYSFGYNYGKPEVRWVSPKEFLLTVPPVFPEDPKTGKPLSFDKLIEVMFESDYEKGLLKNARKAGLNEGDYYQEMPWYDIDEEGKIQNHEGRHRAAVAYLMGIPKIKIVIFHTKFKGLPRDKWEAIEKWKHPEAFKLYKEKRGESLGIKPKEIGKNLDLSKPVKIDTYVRKGKIVRKHSRKKPKF